MVTGWILMMGLVLARADESMDRQYPVKFDDYRCRALRKKVPSPQTPETIAAFAKKKGAKNFYDLFWKAIPQDPELLARFNRFGGLAGIAQSRGGESHAADKKFPRVTFQLPEGLILAGTNHPAHPRTNQLVLGFQFDDKQDPPWWRPFQIDLSKENPTPDYQVISDCTGCHGNPPRPINGAYPHWPGFLTNELPDADPSTSELAKLYPQAMLDGSFQKGGAVEINVIANYHSMRAMLTRLKKSPTYEKHKYGLAAGLMNCKDFPSYVNGDAEKFAKIRKETAVRLLATKKENQELTKRMGGFNGQAREPELGNTIGIAAARYLFEEEGVDFKPYSTDFQPDPDTYGYTFWDGNTGPEFLVCLMEADLGMKLEDITCESLKKKIGSPPKEEPVAPMDRPNSSGTHYEK